MFGTEIGVLEQRQERDHSHNLHCECADQASRFAQISMASSIHSKDKQVFTSDLVESQETSRPSSAEEAEETRHRDQETGIEHAEKTFDARSTKTTESVIPPPPDGGLHAWLKVFGGFLIYVCSLTKDPKIYTDTAPDQYLGFHAQLWCFPSLLQIRSSLLCVSIGHIMDRHRSGLAAHFLRRAVRPAV